MVRGGGVGGGWGGVCGCHEEGRNCKYFRCDATQRPHRFLKNKKNKKQPPVVQSGHSRNGEGCQRARVSVFACCFFGQGRGEEKAGWGWGGRGERDKNNNNPKAVWFRKFLLLLPFFFSPQTKQYVESNLDTTVSSSVPVDWDIFILIILFH